MSLFQFHHFPFFFRKFPSPFGDGIYHRDQGLAEIRQCIFHFQRWLGAGDMAADQTVGFQILRKAS
jgi:hypothetical protein